MLLAGFGGKEKAGRLDHDIDADVAPGEIGRIAFRREADGFAVYDKIGAVNRDIAAEVSMHRVVLQHVGEIIRIEQIVDRHNLNVVKLGFVGGRAEHHAPNPSKTVNCYPNRHVILRLFKRVIGALSLDFIRCAFLLRLTVRFI